MAGAFPWGAATRLGGAALLTTELNSLANNGFSAAGTEYDNTSGLYRFARAVIVLASLNPTAGAELDLFASYALDGTNYPEAPSSTNPGSGMLLESATVTTGSATKRVILGPFMLEPFKVKFVLRNRTAVSLAASANTVDVYGWNGTYT